MPITYKVDQQLGVVVEVWTGAVTATVLAGHWRASLADAEVLKTRKTLADLRKADPQFKGTELAGLLQTIVRPVLGDKKWITANLVERATQYGVARQYSVFAEPFSTDAIFHNYDLALKWLGEQPTTPGP